MVFTCNALECKQNDGGSCKLIDDNNELSLDEDGRCEYIEI